MKRRLLKVLAVLVCLLLSSGIVACDDKGDESSNDIVSSVEEEDIEEEENLPPTAGVIYELSLDATYAIAAKYDEWVNGSVDTMVIASTYEGLPVKSIGDRAFQGCSFKKAIIPEGITSIGDNAFWGCTFLTKIVLPDSLESTGINPFGNINNLRYTVKGGLKYLGNANNPYVYLKGPEQNNITLAIIEEGCRVIGDQAFSQSSNLNQVVIPDSVATIGAYAFAECDNLQYTIKDGLKYLGNDNNPYVYLAGAEKESITVANIESTCKCIGDYAFKDCKNLTHVVIPDGVTSIGSESFYDCKQLKTVSLNKNCALLRIDYSAFANCESLKTITIPDSVIEIGSEAFSYCESLTTIVIPYSVTQIGSYAFAFSNSLKIYCEAESQPSGWYSGAMGWNHSQRPVVWGYTGE